MVGFKVKMNLCEEFNKKGKEKEIFYTIHMNVDRTY